MSIPHKFKFRQFKKNNLKYSIHGEKVKFLSQFPCMDLKVRINLKNNLLKYRN